VDFGQITTWIAAHTPAYYGPAFAAFVIAYQFTGEFAFPAARNLLRGLIFALLLGSKFVVTSTGISPVPLWQHALTGSAGFALVALLFWTIGGYGVSSLLDAMVEALKAASKTLRNSAVKASIFMVVGALGALATAPLGRMLDARWAPPAVQVPADAIPAVIEAIAANPSAAPATVAPAAPTAATVAPQSGMISTVDALAAPAPATAPGTLPSTAPATTPASAPPTTAAPAPATNP
jgi:hypothetical protein